MNKTEDVIVAIITIIVCLGITTGLLYSNAIAPKFIVSVDSTNSDVIEYIGLYPSSATKELPHNFTLFVASEYTVTVRYSVMMNGTLRIDTAPRVILTYESMIANGGIATIEIPSCVITFTIVEEINIS